MLLFCWVPTERFVWVWGWQMTLNLGFCPLTEVETAPVQGAVWLCGVLQECAFQQLQALPHSRQILWDLFLHRVQGPQVHERGRWAAIFRFHQMIPFLSLEKSWTWAHYLCVCVFVCVPIRGWICVSQCKTAVQNLSKWSANRLLKLQSTGHVECRLPNW